MSASLARAGGNAEIARVHGDITERIRVIRRLDFMYTERIRSTYTEHAQVLRAIYESDLVVFLVDARDGLLPLDKEIAGMLRERE